MLRPNTPTYVQRTNAHPLPFNRNRNPIPIPIQSTQLQRTLESTHLLQKLPHQTVTPNRLHDLKRQPALLSKAHLQLELARSAAEEAFHHRRGRKVEDLEGTDAEAEEAVHGLLVVGRHEADLREGAKEGQVRWVGHGGWWCWWC